MRYVYIYYLVSLYGTQHSFSRIVAIPSAHDIIHKIRKRSAEVDVLVSNDIMLAKLAAATVLSETI